MNIEEKMWNTVGTGLKIHAFNNGTALCRSNYKNATPDGNLDHCEATVRARSWGLSLCTTCVAKFNAAIERAEASMQPSTGEGDHLPPAEDTNVPAAPQRTTNEEDSLPIDNGPLTERQIAIIGHVRVGLRYRKVAEQLGISEVLVRREVVAITRKLRATTFQQAIGIYATAMAYRQVALMLDNASRAHPEEDGVAEDHVNHVLTGMAEVCRTAAARLLPQ